MTTIRVKQPDGSWIEEDDADWFDDDESVDLDAMVAEIESLDVRCDRTWYDDGYRGSGAKYRCPRCG